MAPTTLSDGLGLEIPNDDKAWDLVAPDGTTRWCNKYFLWFYSESGLRRVPRPCQSWRCRTHGPDRALRVLRSFREIWSELTDIWFSISYGVAVPVKTFRSRIRQRVGRSRGVDRQYLTILRDFRDQTPDVRVFDAIVFSSIDISKPLLQPSLSVRLSPQIALSVLANVALRQPGVHSLSGSRGPDGWQRPLDELFDQYQSGSKELLGYASEDELHTAFDRAALKAKGLYGIAPVRDAPHPPAVPIDEFRRSIIEELNALRDDGPWPF